MILRAVGAFLIIGALLVLIAGFLAPSGTGQDLLLEYFGIENAWTLSMVVFTGGPVILGFIGAILYRLG